jgi:putative ABC transport system permease protein
MDRAEHLPSIVTTTTTLTIGLALHKVTDSPFGHVDKASPPIPSLIAVIPGTLIAVAVLTAIPARIGARHPVAEVLRSE